MNIKCMWHNRFCIRDISLRGALLLWFVLVWSSSCALSNELDPVLNKTDAVTSNKADPDCWKEIPFALISQKNYKEAIKELNALVKRRPNCAGAYHQLAFCYESIHQNRLAFKAIRKALSFDGNNRRENLSTAAGILAHLGRYAEAASFLSESMKLDSEIYPSTLSCRGTYYYKANQIDLALSDLNAAIELYKGDIDALAFYYRGLCLKRKKLFLEALKDFEKVNSMLGPDAMDNSSFEFSLYSSNKKCLEELRKKVLR